MRKVKICDRILDDIPITEQLRKYISERQLGASDEQIERKIRRYQSELDFEEILKWDVSQIQQVLDLNLGWYIIPEKLLVDRTAIFNDAEFFTFFIDWIKHTSGPISRLFGDESFHRIMTLLLNSEDKTHRVILDDIIKSRAGYALIYSVNESLMPDLVSVPSFLQTWATLIEEKDDILHDATDMIVDILVLSKYSQFTQSPLICSALSKHIPSLLTIMEWEYLQTPVKIYYPWELYLLLSEFPCISATSEFGAGLETQIPLIAYCCYEELIGPNIQGINPDSIIEQVLKIPPLINNEDIQLCIAHSLRMRTGQEWIEQIKSESFMRNNPLILVAMGVTEDLDNQIKRIVTHIKNTRVPLLMVKEVLATPEFQGNEEILLAIKNRVPDIIDLIENAQDTWSAKLPIERLKMILRLAYDDNLLKFSEIRSALLKRLPEYKKYFTWDSEYYEAQKKLTDPNDPADAVWIEFPDIYSLSFVLDTVEPDSPVYVFKNYCVYSRTIVPSLKTATPMHFLPRNLGINLSGLLERLGKSGGQNTVMHLVTLLHQLQDVIRRPAYIRAKNVGSYRKFCSEYVEATILSWIIPVLVDNHDFTVVEPLIKLIEHISKFMYGETRIETNLPAEEHVLEELIGDILTILSHYKSHNELDQLIENFNLGRYELTTRT